MPLTPQAQNILAQLGDGPPQMGAVKKIATTLKKDHALATELWATKAYGPRLLAVLIMDKSTLTQDSITALATDMASHPKDERDKLSEWLMAHQLTKSVRTKALLTTWEHDPSSTLRRLFWYHQGRLRWTGQTPPDNTDELLASLHKNLATEVPEVQWAMNFTAAQIGIHMAEHRATCIALGEKTGLYKGDPVSHGCTPNYLPDYIAIETAKRAG